MLINRCNKFVLILQVEEAQRQIEIQLRERLEQERRDHELALRLARETNSVIDDIQPLTNT